MPSILNKTQVFTNSLKCISNDGKWIGGSINTLKNISDDSEIDTNSFVNSITSYDDGVAFGLSDGRIGILNSENKEEYVNIHTSNICTIDTLNGCILTGSWDHFAVLLIPTQRDRADICLNGNYFTKKIFHHPETVWKVLLLSENTFITGCADNKIRIYKDYTVSKEISYHSHVVRSILVENNGNQPSFIYSVDNYGVLLKTCPNGRIYASRNLDEMCFSMCWYEDMMIVTGECGNIFVIDKDLTVHSKTKLPCSTCWSVRVVDDSILVAGSDGVLYSLSTDDLYTSIDYCETETRPDEGSGVKDGVFVSGGCKYKVEDGKVYQSVGSNWELVGDAHDNSKQHTFTVELEEKKYTLSFGEKENPSEVASRFLNENKINPVHHQEIVDYINQNFRRECVFKRYEKIDIDGISKVLGDHPIINIIKDISNGQAYSILNSDEKNVYEIERALKTIEDEKLFVCLDICKYLFYKKVWIDLSFIFNCKFTNRKEAKAFILLLTNMVENSPFNLSKLNLEIRRLIDQRLLTYDDVMNYEENCSIKSRLNK